MYYILKSVFHYNFYDCNSNQKKLRKNSNRMKDLQILELMCGGKQPNIDTLQIFFLYLLDRMFHRNISKVGK